MSNLALDSYLPAVLETSSIAKEYAYLNSLDLCIYVSRTNELRVTQVGFTNIQILDQNVIWVSVINMNNSYLHIYYIKTDGNLYHIKYNHFSYTQYLIDAIPLVGISNISTIDTLYNSGNYYLIADNNNIHRLYVASDPLFTMNLKIFKTYNNLLDPNYLVTEPRIDFHPSNVGHLLSVGVKRKNLTTQVTDVGVYVVDLLGG